MSDEEQARRGLALLALDAIRWTDFDQLPEDGWDAFGEVLHACAFDDPIDEKALTVRLLTAGWDTCPAADQEKPLRAAGEL